MGKQWKARKVAIVGAGAVGATFCYALAQSGVADEIALIDNNKDFLKGQVLDLVHGLPFFPPTYIHEGDKNDYIDAGVIVITAGAKQNDGETRLDLIDRNITILKSIAKDIAEVNSGAVIVVTTNPVDVLTYVMQRLIGGDSRRVMGSGTVLDSARFRYLLGRHCGIDTRNIHGYILGEHGDSEFAAWSLTHIGGSSIDRYCDLCHKCNQENSRENIVEEVRNSGYHIIDYKGSTYFAIGLALTQIVTAILRNQRSILSVSTLLTGQYGLRDVCLSMPCVISSEGVEQLLEGKLNEKEQAALEYSAAVLSKVIKDIAGMA